MMTVRSCAHAALSLILCAGATLCAPGAVFAAEEQVVPSPLQVPHLFAPHTQLDEHLLGLHSVFGCLD